MNRSIILHPDHKSTPSTAPTLARWLMPRRSTGEEQFRVLCTRVRREIGWPTPTGQVIAITSTLPGEGKTCCSINLASILARDFHHRILLMEADFKRPVLSRAFYSLPGLTEVIEGKSSLEEALRASDFPALQVITAGQPEADRSTELLGSPAMGEILTRLKEQFDLIIVDCPPMFPVADMGLISEWADHILLVIRAGDTDREVVKQAVKALGDSKIVGVVLNGVMDQDRSYSYSMSY